MKTLVVEKYKELPGTSATILLIRAKDLTNRPRTVADINAGVTSYAPKIGDKVRLGEAFTYRTLTPANTTATPPVLEVKAKFIKFDINVDSGHANYETIGDRGYEAFKNGLKGEIIGAGGDAQREFIQEINDDNRCIALLERRESGDYIVLGSQVVPISIKFKGDLGAKAGDKNMIDVEIDDTSGVLFRTYPKELALSIEE